MANTLLSQISGLEFGFHYPQRGCSKGFIPDN